MKRRASQDHYIHILKPENKLGLIWYSYHYQYKLYDPYNMAHIWGHIQRHTLRPNFDVYVRFKCHHWLIRLCDKLNIQRKVYRNLVGNTSATGVLRPCAKISSREGKTSDELKRHSLKWNEFNEMIAFIDYIVRKLLCNLHR